MEDPHLESFKLHLPRILDYLWIAEDGKKMQTSDKFNINSQFKHLKAKYVGTGHADLNRFDGQ